jgi:hypothetical protein
MAKSKLNYDNFNRFDINEACDHFDCESQAQWKKIGKFIVADGQEYQTVMEDDFNFYDTSSNEIEAFDAGVRYAFTKLNAALEAAGVELEITTADLVESMGFMLTRVDDTPEDFVKRVLKKPVMMVDSWV